MKNTLTGTAYNEEVRFYITNGKELVEQIAEYQRTTPIVTAAAGRMAMVTGIMGIMLKGEEKVTTIINGDGPLKQMLATARSNGDVKITVSENNIQNEYYRPGKLNIAAIVGKGTLEVIKDLGLNRPYISKVDLVSGEIIEDFTYYYAKSEQVPTAISGGVKIDEDLKIMAAGALVVQLLPNASEETMQSIEALFSELPPITELLGKMTIEEILNEKLNDVKILAEKNIQFNCDCSAEKYLESLKLLPANDLEDLKREESIECCCHFCLKTYDIKTEDI